MTLFVLAIVGIVFLLVAVISITMIVFLILGIVFRKRDKIASNVFLGLSGFILLVLLCGAIVVFGPKKEEIETPNGTVKVWESTVEEYLNHVANDNMEEVEKMLKEEPALVFSYDINHNDILQSAALNGNVEMMELALEYGAEFDNELIYGVMTYDYSIQSYLLHIGRSPKRYDLTDVDVLEVTKFMLENGASIETNEDLEPNALFYADSWICHDKIISDEDIELVELLHSYGAEYSYELYFNYVEATAMDEVAKDENYDILLDLVAGGF